MGVNFRNLPDVVIPEGDMDKRVRLGPQDGTLRHGYFSNGMKYYVKTCKKPAGRAAIALVVKVGSINEEEQERGVAHIVEHLAFNATDGHSNHDIVRFLESIGAQFGACQNAYTSCDETVYELMIPTDDMSLLDKALQVFAEFAVKVRCAPEDIEKERGAVMEEWRMGNDQSGRTAQAHWKTVLEGCKYAERLPIGLESVIQSVPASVVKGFYDKWYHPGNMAAVVVGDFPDPDAVVKRLRAAMEGCVPRSGAQAPPPVPRVEVAQHAEPRCVAYEDREVVQSQVHLSFKQARNNTSSPAEYREFIKEQLFQQMLNNRFFKISRGENPPFYAAQASSDQLCASGQTFNLSASVAEGAATAAVEALLLEIARVRLYGFSMRELKIAQQHLMSEAETTYLERDQSYSQDVRDEYVRHFLHGEFVVGAEEEARLTKTFLPKISLEDLQPLADGVTPHASCVIKTVEHRRGTSKEELLAAVQRVDALEGSRNVEKWHQDDAPEHLMDASKLVPGSVVSRREYPQLGAVELNLSNGMRCCCKHTKLLEDQVLLTGFAAGGLSEVPKDDFRSANLSPLVSGELGIFGFRPAVVSDILAGKRVEIKPSEGAFWRSFGGDQSPEDLEIALQLVHKLFTSRVSPVESELAVVMRMTKETIAAQIRDPLHTFSNRVRFINYGNCYYFEPFSMAEFRRVNPKVSCDHFNQSYCSPADFTLCLTGNINIPEITPLLEKYIASIPVPNDAKEKLSPKDVKQLPYSFPAQPVVEEVHVPMVTPITQAQITFPVEIPRDNAREEAVWISLCCRLLETRLMQLMRFKFGEVYTVSVSPFFGVAAPSTQGIVTGDIALGFSCDPANSRGLIQAALQEICKLQEEGPTAEDVKTVLTLEHRQHELQQDENSFWQEQLVGGYQSRSFQENGDLDFTYTQREAARAAVVAAADPESVKVAMQRLLPYPATKRYTAVTMVPSNRWRWLSPLVAPIESVGGIFMDTWQHWSPSCQRAIAICGALLAGAGVLAIASQRPRARRN